MVQNSSGTALVFVLWYWYEQYDISHQCEHSIQYKPLTFRLELAILALLVSVSEIVLAVVFVLNTCLRLS